MIHDDDAFDDRKKSQEAKYKMDEEKRFKARSRRNKLLGLWAAGRLGMTEADAQAFARDVVIAASGLPGDAMIAGWLLGELESRGAGVAEAEIVAEMARLLPVAEQQIAEEFPKALDSDHEPVGG